MYNDVVKFFAESLLDETWLIVLGTSLVLVFILSILLTMFLIRCRQ